MSFDLWDFLGNAFKPVADVITTGAGYIQRAFDFDFMEGNSDDVSASNSSSIPSSPGGWNGMANVGSSGSWGDALKPAAALGGGLLKDHGAAILGGAAQAGIGYLGVQEQAKAGRQAQERTIEANKQATQEERDWQAKERERVKKEWWDYHNKKGFMNVARAPGEAMFKGKAGLLGR